MIKVHSYCSYKHSPSGFVYGSFIVEEKTENTDYTLTENNNTNIVQIAFENGIIRRLCGKIPDSCNYIFLVRKLKYNYGNNHSDIGREVQMNFGFEFDSFDEFLSFVCGYYYTEENDAQALYHQLADCIVPDENVETYKYKIIKESFNSWIDSIKSESSSNGIELLDKYRKSLCITASSSSFDYTKEINELFELKKIIGEPSGEFRRENNTEFYWYKKKSTSKNQISNLTISKKKMLILIAVAMMIFIILGFLGIQLIKFSEKSIIITMIKVDDISLYSFIPLLLK